MAGNLGRLNVELTAGTVGFNKAMDKAAFKATNSFNKITSGVQRMAGMFALALGPAVLGRAIKRVIDDADELGKMSRKIGVSVQSLSVWRHAAQLAGSEFAVLTKGVARFSRVMSDASAGLMTAKRPLDQLGVSFQNTNGTLRNVEEAMLDVADSFQKMENGAKKAALAQELFGRAGVELIPFLNEGRSGIEKIRIEAERLGIVFTTEMAAGAEMFNDNLTRLQAKLKGLLITFGNDIIPVLVRYSDRMVDAAKGTEELKKSTTSFGDVLLTIGTAAQLTDTSIKSLVVTIGDLAAVQFLIAGKLGPEALFGPIINTVRHYDEIKAIVEKNSKDQRSLWSDTFDAILRDRLESLKTLQSLTNESATSAIEEQAAALAEEQKIMAEGARITKSVRTEIEKLIDTQELLNKLIMAGAIDQETYNRAADKAIALFDKQDKKAKEVNSTMQELGATFSSQFENAIVEGKKFSEVLKGLEEDLIRIAVRKAIVDPLIGAIFGGPGGGGLFGSAKGNVFSAGALSMFANGGVLNSPIAFPMKGGRAGVAGEAGPEAILPLMRTSGGDLGVNANVGNRVNINVHTPPGSRTSEERQTEGGVETINLFIDDAVAGNVHPGTKTYKALKENFGLGTKLINR